MYRYFDWFNSQQDTGNCQGQKLCSRFQEMAGFAKLTRGMLWFTEVCCLCMSYDYGDFWHKCKALKVLYKGHTNLSMIENLGSDVMRVVDLLVFNSIGLKF